MSDYTNSETQYRELEILIEKIIEKKLLSVLDSLGVEASDYAVVSSIDSAEYETVTDAESDTETQVIKSVSRVSVELPNGEKIRELINGSGEILEVGDKVKIFGSRSNMSNRYVGMRYTNI